MTNKNKKNKAVSRLSNRLKNTTIAKVPKTPFRDVGGIIGKRIASLTGMSGAHGVGKWLGTGIGSIFGSGDYEMVGAPSEYNVLAGSPPQFSSTQATNVVCHREYLGDVIGTAAFVNNQFPINPGMAQTFPWLSTIAQNYQEYRFHGLVFEFKSLLTDYVTNGTPGVVVMATNYNSGAASYTTKQQMENSEFAVSNKPTRDLLHMVECKRDLTVLPHNYVRNGPVPNNQDIRLHDQGNFQLVTQGNPAVNIGELWVTYCVEFVKPTTVATAGPVVAGPLFVHAKRTGCTTTIPIGNDLGTDVGNLTLNKSPTGFSWNGQAGEKYLIEIFWSSGTALTLNNPAIVPGNCVLLTRWKNNTYDNVRGAVTPTVNTDMMLSVVVQVAVNGTTSIDIIGGIMPPSSESDIVVIRLPDF
jgi:hypothetical protein